MDSASDPNPQPYMRRYRLARNFALCALVLLGVAGWATYRFQSQLAVDHLVELTSRHNAAATQLVANSLWPRYGDFLQGAQEMGAETVRGHALTTDLTAAVARLLADTEVMKIKLYDLEGFTAFSTQAVQIGADYSDNPRFLAAQAGDTHSKLEFRDSFGAITGPRAAVWVLSSYVPVRRASDNTILGVAEIYTDVTALYADIARLERRELAVIAAVFAVVFVVLTLIVGNAERQIRRHHHASLRQASRAARAEAASEAKSQFLANMSHELRTPLNAIIGFADMIRNAVYGPVGEPRYCDYAADIETSGRHLLAIIDDVLELVRLDTDKLQVNAAPFEVTEIGAEVVRLLQAEADKRQVTLGLHSDGSPAVAMSDAIKVRQILVNLAFNALKFTPAGGEVRIEVMSDAAGLRIAVRDTGIGMSDDEIVVALQPFGQVQPALTRSEAGTGLGLPLSKRLAEALGGRLEVASAPGVGTTVSLWLPVPVDAAATVRLAG